MITYVYDGTEVKKTGRIAHKKLTSGKVIILSEITPVHQLSGTWLKWVQDDQLFQIQEPTKNGPNLPNL